jgi:hypothetical protein
MSAPVARALVDVKTGGWSLLGKAMVCPLELIYSYLIDPGSATATSKPLHGHRPGGGGNILIDRPFITRG